MIAFFNAECTSELINYQNDHLGTPIHIVGQNSAVVWAAQHDSFGKTTITTNTIENNLRFPGQYYDEETGTHYNFFRDYDPSTGRYMQSDPIGLAGGINTYSYVDNNPLIFIDPLGLRFRPAPNPFRLPPNVVRDRIFQNLSEPDRECLLGNCFPKLPKKPKPICYEVCPEDQQECEKPPEPNSGKAQLPLPSGCKLICETGPQIKNQ